MVNKRKKSGKKRPLKPLRKNKWAKTKEGHSEKSGMPSWVPIFNIAWKVALTVFVVFLILIIRTFGIDKQKSEEQNIYVERISPMLLAEWEERYFGGFQIVIFSDGKIKRTSENTLDKELKIDWWDVGIKLKEPNQFTGEEAKIEIEIPHIEYTSDDINDVTLSCQFRRKVGAKGFMGDEDGFNIVVEVVEDWGDELVFLFGLNDRGFR